MRKKKKIERVFSIFQDTSTLDLLYTFMLKVHAPKWEHSKLFGEWKSIT